MRNLSQATYNRIRDRLYPNSDRWAMPLATQDARDLLEAYQGALQLLEEMVLTRDGRVQGDPEVVDFVCFANGELRVDRDPEPEQTESLW